MKNTRTRGISWQGAGSYSTTEATAWAIDQPCRSRDLTLDGQVTL